MQCPTKDELNECLLGKVPDARAEVLLDHAEQCRSCRSIVAALDSTSDRVTATLRNRSSPPDVSAECERMIDRAEVYVQAEHLAEPSAATKQHLLQGTQVRDYELIRPIGEGGMGAVFLARHNRLKRDVALKVLSLRRSGDREAQQRFEQEMTIVGKLQHPGIVRALDAGEHEGVQYLVMELVDGADLRQVVDALGPISVADACEICRQTAIALDYAHGQQLIHRDVKPSNIMLSKEGAVKVMDLGLARFTDQHLSLTSTKQAMGSLDFMAPEQLRAEAVDHRADVYGLACTLHFLLLGEPPEKRRTASLLVSRAPKLEALRGVLPPPLTRLLQQMLAIEPTKRCNSLSSVSDQLAPFCNQADLQQLATKATSLVREDAIDEPGSITSSIEQTETPKGIPRRAWIAIASGVALAVALPFAWSYFNPSSAEANQVREITALPCVSSNIEPTREVPLFQIHDGAVRCVAFCESTSQLICGSDDASVSIRDLPNQQRVIRVCKFDSPIKRISVAAETRRFACLDQSGAISVIELPGGGTVWHLAPTETVRQVTDIVVLSNQQLAVRREDGSTERLSINDGTLIAGDDDTQNFPRIADSFEADNRLAKSYTDGLLAGGESIRAAAIDSPHGPLCVIDGHLARLMDVENLDEKHFVYAEHAVPICSVLALPGESLFFSGDESGEIRLWQAPNRPRSDMLLSCPTKIDSSEMTFGIHRQKQWSRESFSTPPDEVKYDDPSNEVRIETEIHRNGRRHVLEYRINASSVN